MVKKTPSFNNRWRQAVLPLFTDVVAREMSLGFIEYRGVAMDAVRIVTEKARYCASSTKQGRAPTNVYQSQPKKNFARDSSGSSKFLRHWWRQKWEKKRTKLSAWTWTDGWGHPTFSVGLAEEIISIRNLSEKFSESDYRFGVIHNLRCWNSFWCLSQKSVMFPLTDDSGRVVLSE